MPETEARPPANSTPIPSRRSPRVRDPHARHLQRLATGAHPLSRRGREPVVHQGDHVLDGEAVRDHERLGATIGARGQQRERALPITLATRHAAGAAIAVVGFRIGNLPGIRIMGRFRFPPRTRWLCDHVGSKPVRAAHARHLSQFSRKAALAASKASAVPLARRVVNCWSVILTPRLGGA